GRLADLRRLRQRLDGSRVRRADRIDHGGQHHPLYKRRMEGRIPVTFQRFPQPDADFLFDVGRVDAVLTEPVALDQHPHLAAVIGQKLVQALTQSRVDSHGAAIITRRFSADFYSLPCGPAAPTAVGLVSPTNETRSD